jgi:hypothetical protein
MKNVAYVYASRQASRTVPSGAVNRKQDIEDFLMENGFEVEQLYSLPKKSPIKKGVLVLVSFPSAKLLKRAKKHFSFVWFDPTDSWKLTRRELFKYNYISGIAKCIRDSLNFYYYKKADLITYCSRRDLRFDGLRNSRVMVLNHKVRRSSSKSSLEPRFVFVGHGEYPPNREAVNFLFDLFSKEDFSIQLHVYGAGYEKDKSTPKIIFEGVAPDLEIYREKDIHLVPIWHGAGVKYKTLNALSKNLRVISSIEGANGFVAGVKLSIAHDKEGFVELLRTTLSENPVLTFSDTSSEQPILESDDHEEIIRILNEFSSCR